MATVQADSKSLEAELKEMRALLERQGKEMKGMKGQIGLHRKKLGLGRPGEVEKEPEPSPIEAPPTESKPQEATQAHHVHPWQAFCPDCGGEGSPNPNPDFKDETRCANEKCGMHLGSLETAIKLKGCPSCGKKSIVPLGAEVEKRAKELIKIA